MREASELEDDRDSSTNPYESPLSDSPSRIRWSYSLLMALAILRMIVLLCIYDIGIGAFFALASAPAYLRASYRISSCS